MGECTAAVIEATWKKPAKAKRAGALLGAFSEVTAAGIDALVAEWPELKACAADGRVTLPPEGEYGIESVEICRCTISVGLESGRYFNAQFQVAAVIELCRAVDQDCVFSVSVTCPDTEHSVVRPGDPNPFLRTAAPPVSESPAPVHGAETSPGDLAVALQDNGDSIIVLRTIGSEHAVADIWPRQISAAEWAEVKLQLLAFDKLRAVSQELVAAINATGGVFEDAEGMTCPEADPEWADLGSVYLQACAALGVPPQWDNQED